MSAAVSGPPGRKGGTAREPIDLDMTPMMNVLIILISFLVTMVVFTHLAVIQFELPSSDNNAGGAAADSGSPADDLTLVISEGGYQIIGADRKENPIPKTRSGYDFRALGTALQELHAQYPVARSLVLLIDPDVLYQDIISTMDVCRAQRFPDVLLSGGVGG